MGEDVSLGGSRASSSEPLSVLSSASDSSTVQLFSARSRSSLLIFSNTVLIIERECYIKYIPLSIERKNGAHSGRMLVSRTHEKPV